jgi:uncharacterized protein YkwD
VLVSFTSAEDKKDTKKEGIQLTKDETAIIELTNEERKKSEKDLKPLKMNPKLMEAARKHATNMAAQEKLEHILDEKTVAHRVKAEGYKYRAVGENIAMNAKTPKEVVEGWMDSEPHRENILKSQYTEIGVAVVKSEKGEPYWVQVFAKP